MMGLLGEKSNYANPSKSCLLTALMTDFSLKITITVFPSISPLTWVVKWVFRTSTVFPTNRRKRSYIFHPLNSIYIQKVQIISWFPQQKKKNQKVMRKCVSSLSLYWSHCLFSLLFSPLQMTSNQLRQLLWKHSFNNTPDQKFLDGSKPQMPNSPWEYLSLMHGTYPALACTLPAVFAWEGFTGTHFGVKYTHSPTSS